MIVGAFLSAHEVEVVPSIAAARAALTTNAFDVVLVDYDLDDGKDARAQPHDRDRREGNDALARAGADRVCGKLEMSRIAAVLDELLR